MGSLCLLQRIPGSPSSGAWQCHGHGHGGGALGTPRTIPCPQVTPVTPPKTCGPQFALWTLTCANVNLTFSCLFPRGNSGIRALPGTPEGPGEMGTPEIPAQLSPSHLLSTPKDLEGWGPPGIPVVSQSPRRTWRDGNPQNSSPVVSQSPPSTLEGRGPPEFQLSCLPVTPPEPKGPGGMGTPRIPVVSQSPQRTWRDGNPQNSSPVVSQSPPATVPKKSCWALLGGLSSSRDSPNPKNPTPGSVQELTGTGGDPPKLRIPSPTCLVPTSPTAPWGAFRVPPPVVSQGFIPPGNVPAGFFWEGDGTQTWLSSGWGAGGAQEEIFFSFCPAQGGGDFV
ncbi:leucine-rich repeat extensin-like protein 5 isoform X1 [Corapipo altera]|uniref:leucine-rich repeat extensin-like protein 5 isoform X1 n=1 Tax=Corapipo altera TaxID=415028 RepID=UPI000FD67218|nr:leucine-rich repeat extensin-like protein 5 isoform X1 [Corapipo altera]